MKPNLTNLKPTVTTPNNQNEIKKVQEEVANLSPKIMEPQDCLLYTSPSPRD